MVVAVAAAEPRAIRAVRIGSTASFASFAACFASAAAFIDDKPASTGSVSS